MNFIAWDTHPTLAPPSFLKSILGRDWDFSKDRLCAQILRCSLFEFHVFDAPVASIQAVSYY